MVPPWPTWFARDHGYPYKAKLSPDFILGRCNTVDRAFTFSNVSYNVPKRKMSSQSLPPPRRILTTHSADGASTVLRDGPVPLVRDEGFNANVAGLWEMDRFPAVNKGNNDPMDRKDWGLVPEKGVTLRVVDFPGKSTTVCELE